MIDKDIYKSGASLAHNKPLNEITKEERNLFKRAFFETMHEYIYFITKLGGEGKENFLMEVREFDEGTKMGRSFEEIKEIIVSKVIEEKI